MSRQQLDPICQSPIAQQWLLQKLIHLCTLPKLSPEYPERPGNLATKVPRSKFWALQGVKSVAEIAKDKGLHVVLVSSALVTPKNRYSPIRLILNNIRWSLMDAKVTSRA